MRSRRRVAVAVGPLLAIAAGIAPAAAADEVSATLDPTTDEVVHVSAGFPYTLALPKGWELVFANAEEDLFQGPEATARVGGAPAEPGDSVESRVTSNRADEIGSGCTSDPADDRPTTLGGSDAILWTWTCPGSHHAAINTIRDGQRLRLQVNVPSGSESLAAPLLEQLRQGFSFAEQPLADGGDLAGIDAQLQGTYETAWYPIELAVATLEAAGVDDRSDQEWWAWMEAAAEAGTTGRLAVKFDDGTMIQYVAEDGGPLEVGLVATYRLLDDHTIEATEVGTFLSIVFEFKLRDGILTSDVVSSDAPGAMGPQTAFFETLPFTRVS
jgi:hypothetical protein